MAFAVVAAVAVHNKCGIQAAQEDVKKQTQAHLPERVRVGLSDEHAEQEQLVLERWRLCTSGVCEEARALEHAVGDHVRGEEGLDSIDHQPLEDLGTVGALLDQQEDDVYDVAFVQTLQLLLLLLVLKGDLLLLLLLLWLFCCSVSVVFVPVAVVDVDVEAVGGWLVAPAALGGERRCALRLRLVLMSSASTPWRHISART